MYWTAGTTAGIDLYENYDNLVFNFDPLPVNSNLAQTAHRRVLRWPVRLSLYNYVCVHVKSAENMWANFLERSPASRIVCQICERPKAIACSKENFWMALGGNGC